MSTIEALKAAREALQRLLHAVNAQAVTLDERVAAQVAINQADADIAAAGQQPKRDSTWFALVMGAAAEIEDAANCLRDEDARRTALSGAKHYRDKANALFAASPVAAAEPHGTQLTITLRQAEKLLLFFGGHDAEVEVAVRGNSLHAWCTEYPEEGTQDLGPTEVDDDLAAHGRPVAAAERVEPEPVAWWNSCDKTVPAALRFLAANQRPSGGSEMFNAEHLLQLASEIERMAASPLYAHPPAAQAAAAEQCSTCGQTDVGQYGEYHCQTCGLPRTWDVAAEPMLNGLTAAETSATASCAGLSAAAAETVEMSPDFTDTPRAALLWVLWHHQGASSPVGQPIRFALGMGAHDRLNDRQISEAQRWAAVRKSSTADFHKARAAAEQRGLPHPGSPEASAMIDSLLAEYGWPSNAKNAARAGYMAAQRLSGPCMAAAPAAQAPLTDEQLRVLWFLYGTGTLMGCGFGTNQENAKGNFWWRKYLAAAFPALRGVPPTDDCHGLDTPERVRFYEHDFYVLSNFSAFTLLWKGIRFDTSEAAYHFEKFSDGAGALADVRAIQYSIRTAPSAHEAYKIAERNKAHRRPDWDDVKVGIMREILREKVAQHEYVRRKLLATGDRELVEDSWRDDYWGWGPNRDGQNMLGKLWMEIRAELRAAGTQSQAAGEA